MEKYLQAQGDGRPFDIMILDLMIRGGMGGEETARKTREINPKVKAVVSEGYTVSPVVADFRDHRFSTALHKP